MITTETTELKHMDLNDPVLRNGLEDEITRYKEESLNELKFSVVLKPAIISFLALILSFFLDLAYVPLLGDVSVQLGQWLFPTWQPAAEDVVPYSFWWLPVVVYSLFVLLAYLAFNKLKTEVIRSSATETIDRIITSYTSVIDGIATALPLIGAAVLLISIKLGDEIFLGLSVPFEIKALIVLAIGKLFEPVVDQLGVEFQNIVNHVKDIKEKHFSRMQIENSRTLLKQFNTPQYANLPDISQADMANYRDLLEETTKYSEVLVANFTSLHTVLEKIRSIETLTADKITELNKLAENLSNASKNLGDEKTITGLKHLENIVVRK
jgi:hypothetical protein